VANFFKPAIYNNMVAGLTAVTFLAGVMQPPQLHAAGVNLDIGAINFGIKMEKIYEKMKRCIDKGETNKIVGYMFDIKHEVEGYTGKKIDMNKQLDQVQREAKAKGQKIDDAHMKQIKKWFHKGGDKHKHRAVWFAQCAEVDIPYTMVEADHHFEMNYMMAKAAKGHDKEIDVPITVTVGVTLSLAGLFLMFVPIPICQTAGWYIMDTGIGILGSHALGKWEEYNQNEKH
jgi:hypothetical protein